MPATLAGGRALAGADVSVGRTGRKTRLRPAARCRLHVNSAAKTLTLTNAAPVLGSR
jgi:hypothetical protein